MSTILLRDIPKDVVQLDLTVYQVQGGFRGFSGVPPGLHYVAIPGDSRWPGFWAFLQPEEVRVQQFFSELQQFTEDDSEDAATYRQLARQGAMTAALKPYQSEQEMVWRSLTHYITPPLEPLQSLPGTLTATIEQSRFEQVFLDLHQGHIPAFRADFQFAFLNWMLSLHHNPDANPPQRWSHLLNASYNAGDRQMAQYPELFTKLVDVILVQFAQLPASCFEPDSFIRAQLDYLLEDLTDTGIQVLQQQAQRLQTYIQEQRQKP